MPETGFTDNGLLKVKRDYQMYRSQRRRCYELRGGEGRAQKVGSARGLCARISQAEDAGLEALRDTEASEGCVRRD